MYIGTHRHALVKQFDGVFDFIFVTNNLILNNPIDFDDTFVFEELQTRDFENRLSPVSGTNRKIFQLETGNYNLLLSGTTEREDTNPQPKRLRLRKSSDVNGSNKETIIEIDPDGSLNAGDSVEDTILTFDETVNFTIDTKPFITLELTYTEGVSIDFDLTYRFERTGLL